MPVPLKARAALASHARRLGDGPQSHSRRAQRRELPPAARAAAARLERRVRLGEVRQGAAAGATREAPRIRPFS